MSYDIEDDSDKTLDPDTSEPTVMPFVKKVFEKLVDNPAGTGLVAIMVGIALKKFRPPPRLVTITVKPPTSAPVTPSTYQVWVQDEGFDVKYDVFPLSGNTSEMGIVGGLLEFINYFLKGKKGSININPETGEVWLSDLLILAGLLAISGGVLGSLAKLK